MFTITTSGSICLQLPKSMHNCTTLFLCRSIVLGFNRFQSIYRSSGFASVNYGSVSFAFVSSRLCILSRNFTQCHNFTTGLYHQICCGQVLCDQAFCIFQGYCKDMRFCTAYLGDYFYFSNIWKFIFIRNTLHNNNVYNHC